MIKVVSSIPQQVMAKWTRHTDKMLYDKVSYLQQISFFTCDTPISSTTITDHRDIIKRKMLNISLETP